MGVPKGVRIGGRKKGTPNKFSRDIKQSILKAYDAIGGDDAFAEWARDNKTEFYKIHAKLIPKDVNLHGELRLEEIVAGDEDSEEPGR